MARSLGELAELVDGELAGNPSIQITGAADIADAVEGEIVFAETPKHLGQAERSRASAIVTYRDASNSSKPIIRVANPRYAFAQILSVFSPEKHREGGIHPTSVVGEGTSIGENPSIGYNVYIGRNTKIGKNAWIYPFVFIGDNVEIGDDCVLHPFVALQDGIYVGNNVTIHSGTVIGSDGFGYTRIGDEHFKIPQIGTVVVGDNVEIGANVTIDRARTGKTTIGSGTKIDNLVHIAHNVTVGKNCIIVAQVGISGSCELGDRVVLAGQSGLKDHLVIGDDAIICARAGVIGDVEPGAFVSGYPARPHREQMRMHAVQQRLPSLLRELKELEKRVQELEERSGK